MLKIGDRAFEVGIVKLERGIKRELKYDVTTEDGTRRSEIRAIYPTYSVTLGPMEQAEYDALYAAVTSYAASLSVTLPDGQQDITVDVTVDVGGDGLVFVERSGNRIWDGLSLTFTGVKPLSR